MTAETSNARGFAVGERVRAIFVGADNKGFIRQGDTGTVKHIESDGDLWVKWDNPADSDQQDCGWCINADHCERIAPPPAAEGAQAGEVEQQARELLAAEYAKDERYGMAHAARNGSNDVMPAIRAIEAALSTQAQGGGEVVAWCALTPSGKIAYFDGKPMVMVGPVGNEHCTTPLYTAPPSAPVGVEGLVAKWRKESESLDIHPAGLAARRVCAIELEHALAQQPAAARGEVPYDRELIARMLDVCGHPMFTLGAYREQARLLREADNAGAEKVGTARALAAQPGGSDNDR